MKPILFNTDMVRAILDGRKTQTRRLIKEKGWNVTGVPRWSEPYDGEFWFAVANEKAATCININPPYQSGDILWVRETWKQATTGTAGPGLIDLYLYKADEPQDTTGMMVEDRWHPSIHMPRKAARLFLHVKDVRAERLHDMTVHDFLTEGTPWEYGNIGVDIGHMRAKVLLSTRFSEIWNSTIKPDEHYIYGWDTNPWVWVIEFERTTDRPFGVYADRDTASYADAGVLMPAT